LLLLSFAPRIRYILEIKCSVALPARAEEYIALRRFSRLNETGLLVLPDEVIQLCGARIRCSDGVASREDPGVGFC